MVFHGNSEQPTEAGMVLLKKAGVKIEDLLQASPVHQKFISSRSPTIESRIQRTLALLKVASVIARQKFDKQSLFERQKIYYE